MSENVTERIANRLAEIFPDATIYAENQKSGFDVPSFYIAKTTTQSKNRFFDTQDRTLSFQLVYFANPKHPNADMEQVEELLLDNFTRLGTYATVRNREFRTNQEEQTLTLTFDVDQNMFRVDNTIKMRRSDVDSKLKGLRQNTRTD